MCLDKLYTEFRKRRIYAASYPAFLAARVSFQDARSDQKEKGTASSTTALYFDSIATLERKSTSHFIKICSVLGGSLDHQINSSAKGGRWGLQQRLRYLKELLLQSASCLGSIYRELPPRPTPHMRKIAGNLRTKSAVMRYPLVLFHWIIYSYIGTLSCTSHGVFVFVKRHDMKNVFRRYLVSSKSASLLSNMRMI